MKKTISPFHLFGISMAALFFLACGLTSPTPESSPSATNPPEESTLSEADDAPPLVSPTPPSEPGSTENSTENAESSAEALNPMDEILASIPLLEDATELYKSSENGQTYVTQKNLEEAVLFYRNTLPELGWTYDQEASVTGSQDIYRKDGIELILQIYGSNNQRVVTMNIYPVEEPQEVAQSGELQYPEDALVIDFRQKGETEDFQGEFLTDLTFDELIAFYRQAYPSEAGWHLIPYPPSEEAFADGARGNFYIQSKEREFTFFLELDEDGRTAVTFSYEPIANYQDANLPEDLLNLVALVGDAKDVNKIADNWTFIIFFSHKPVDEVLDLYRNEVGNLGWQVVGEDTSTTGMTTLYLEKEGESWKLIVDMDFSSTTITLVSQ